MAAAEALKELIATRTTTTGDQSVVDRIKKTQTDELVFALCGPIGSPIHAVAASLSTTAKAFGYEPEIILLSDYISEHKKKADLSKDAQQTGSDAFKRVRSLIEIGNELRDKYGAGILTELGITRILQKRVKTKNETESKRFAPIRRCHIFDSIKNQAELDVLRLVYGNLLFCVGITAPLSNRKGQLAMRGLIEEEINTLISQDSGEELEHGQTVRDTFPQSDYFIKIDKQADAEAIDEINKQSHRLLSLITQTKISTPSIAETAMYAATSSAAKSACLSRQVGAAITDSAGKIIGTGWNDVPRFGGGLYDHINAENDTDKRCYLGEVCHNDDRKAVIVEETISKLIKEGLIDPAKKDDAGRAIANSRVRDLIEFSRAVHAEMLAIINTSQSTGSQMKGGTIYCTTYPCHSCARHIVAAGIEEVVYIEPYRKSLAIVLHGDALTETGEKNKVRLTQYAGVAPRRFLSLFQAESNSRKKDGKKRSPDAATANIVSRVSLESIPVLEGLVLDEIVKTGLIERQEEARGDEKRSA